MPNRIWFINFPIQITFRQTGGEMVPWCCSTSLAKELSCGGGEALKVTPKGAAQPERLGGNHQTVRVATEQQKAKGRCFSAPFCCPSPQVMEFDFDWCGGIYPEGARHNGLLCEPKGREILPAHPLCIRRRYVTSRHT